MKFENISEFPLIILVGISEYWDASLSFNSLISVSMYWKLTSLKLKTPFLLHLVLIARIIECSLYLTIAFKMRLTFSIIGSESEYREVLRFFTILPKKCEKPQLFLFQFSQFHHFHSNLFFLWHWIFRTMKAVLFSKNVCY